MSYFLKKTTPTSKGVYLQIYQSFYISGKGKRNKSFKKLGYVSELIEKGISDPISFFQAEVDTLNKNDKQNKELQISDIPTLQNVGYFLMKSMFNKLDMDSTINIVASTYKAKYTFSDMIKALCYAQVINPGSKLKAFENVIPGIYGIPNFSYDQILDAVEFIGSDYHKYIEILNKSISNNWTRNFNKVYFDCTNYYFEIDSENNWLKKGPSKENQKSPLLGQALLLDADQIPLDTQFYPGNESEKPFLRERIENMKSRNNVTGRVIQVADKGLNCARNIYAAVVEANDGYIFSKSLRGKSLTKEQKSWVLASDDTENIWYDVRDDKGNLIYKYKTVKSRLKNGALKDYGKYSYHCRINKDDAKETTFEVKEKRIVSYNYSLAKKQKAEILKQVDKLKGLISYKSVIKDELGDSSKYVNLDAIDFEGKKIKIATSLNTDKINEDLELCGYNMIVTSEINADPKEIYKIYHNLWRIEESFRIMKSYLDARPVFLQKKNSIYGHFLICYVSLTILRLLELKVFKDVLPPTQLIEFMRQYNVTKTIDENYINTSTPSETYSLIKEKLGLVKLGNVYLSKRDIDLLLDTELD